MADDLSKYLLSGAGGFTLTPEKLELMGKEAAALLVEKSVPLTDSIVKIASQHPDMNAEQVRRVVEFANTSAYLSFHDKNKTAGSETSYPQFTLADPQVVLKKLSNAQTTKISHDVSYMHSPKKTKTANASREAALEKLFLGERTKTASVDFSPETAAKVIMDAKHDLTDLKSHLAGAGERFDSLFKQAQADYYDSMKRHLLDGGSFADILRGAHETGLPTEKISMMLTPIVAQIIKEKVASPSDLASQSRELTKVAHREVDASHPFVAGFAAMNTLFDETEKVAAALDDVETQLARVKLAIKEEFIDR